LAPPRSPPERCVVLKRMLLLCALARSWSSPRLNLPYARRYEHRPGREERPIQLKLGAQVTL
jgi:hypothetical protein